MSEPLSPVQMEVTTNLKRGILSDEEARLPLQACWMPSLGLHPRKHQDRMCAWTHTVQWNVALSLWSDFAPLSLEDLGGARAAALSNC